MIALLLMAQLSTAVVSADTPRSPATDMSSLDVIVPNSKDGIIRVIRSLPAKACGGAGRMEASFAQPTALYRNGDRPPKLYIRWNDYPDGRLCSVGAAR